MQRRTNPNALSGALQVKVGPTAARASGPGLCAPCTSAEAPRVTPKTPRERAQQRCRVPCALQVAVGRGSPAPTQQGGMAHHRPTLHECANAASSSSLWCTRAAQTAREDTPRVRWILSQAGGRGATRASPRCGRPELGALKVEARKVLVFPRSAFGGGCRFTWRGGK